MARSEKPKTSSRATTRRRPKKPEATPVEAVDQTPSGKALAKVGNLDGETVKHDGYEAANEHGEKYLAEKRKHRWG